MLIKLPVFGQNKSKSISMDNITGLEFSIEEMNCNIYFRGFTDFRLEKNLLDRWKQEEISLIDENQQRDVLYQRYRPEKARISVMINNNPKNNWDRPYKLCKTYFAVPRLDIIFTEFNGSIKGSGSISGRGSFSSRSYSGLFYQATTSSGSSWIEGSSKIEGKFSGVKKIILLGELANQVNEYLEKELGTKSFVPNEKGDK